MMVRNARIAGCSGCEGSKIIIQKVAIGVDWVNSDDVRKGYAAKKLAEE